MATVQDAIDRIKGRLRRDSDDALDSRIRTELQALQDELEQGPVFPHFLLTELASYTLTAGEPRVPVPEDFIMEYEDGTLFIEESDGSTTAIEKDVWESIKPRPDRWEDSDTPRAYALVGNNFRLVPTPDSALTLKMIYYARDTKIGDLSDNQSNKWLTNQPSVMINGAGMNLAKYHLRDADATKMFQQDYQAAYNRFHTHEAALEAANYDGAN